MARNIGEDPREMVEEIKEFESKNELLVDLAMAVAADGELSSSEKELLTKIAGAIDVDQADLEMLVKTALRGHSKITYPYHGHIGT
jgi:uncharacterized tellurite resistance protein B-like protein